MHMFTCFAIGLLMIVLCSPYAKCLEVLAQGLSKVQAYIEFDCHGLNLFFVVGLTHVMLMLKQLLENLMVVLIMSCQSQSQSVREDVYCGARSGSMYEADMRLWRNQPTAQGLYSVVSVGLLWSLVVPSCAYEGTSYSLLQSSDTFTVGYILATNGEKADGHQKQTSIQNCKQPK